MQDGYPVTWMGSEDVKDKTGIGTFIIDGNSYDIPLCNFKHCQTIKKMINKAFTQGRDFSEGRISDCLVRAINDKAKNREFVELEEIVKKITIALNDAIRRPMGVVPDSALEFVRT